MALSWGEKNPEKVSAFAGIYPVSNIANYPGIEKAASAYAKTAADLVKSLPDVNPIDNLSSFAKARVPFYVIHGDSDEIVPIEQNSKLLQYRYLGLGGSMQLQIVKDQGHSVNKVFFENNSFKDFVIKHSVSGISCQRSAP